ncbi:MAG: S9 family peptidase [Bryobacterales bacterium]|nr:S9 family peptidase [Bryobacterales bacterium]
MPRFHAPVLLLVVCFSAVFAKKPVSIEALSSDAASEQPIEPVWAPNGGAFVYERRGELRLYDATSGRERQLTAVEPLERRATAVPKERPFAFQNRRVRERRLQWLPDGKQLLISAGGDLFLWNVAAGGYRQLTATPEREADPTVSPDGRRVSFRRANELYVMDIESGETIRLTHDASSTLWNARLDWVYPEELEIGTAHWWSPDSRSIAYMQFDVSREMIYPQVDLLGLNAILEPQRYPKAGTPNADVRVGIVPAGGGRTLWLHLGQTRDHLYARLDWLPDSRFVAVQRLNRVQNRLTLISSDIETGRSRVMLEETDPYWVNLADGLTFLSGDRFLWPSERSGYRHLYLYSPDGVHQLTKGDWEVKDVACVDGGSGEIYYVSTQASPLERHLYRVGLNGAPPERITKAAGTHTVSMGPGCGYYVDTHSSLSEPPQTAVHKASGDQTGIIGDMGRRLAEEYEFLPVEIVTVKASDGATLYSRLIKPAGFESGRKYPAIVLVYGGPHAQSVLNQWMGLKWEQALAHRGFVVWQLDNRGTAGRGHAWETRLYRRFGKQELEDQEAGVRHLVETGFVDAGRIGISGWSYGGFMTLYALLHAPDLFRAGIAGAPVTDWRNYDTIYTERYLGLPSENEAGYRESSPVHYAANLKASLMLVHNIEDDNVLFQNTVQMLNELQEAGKPFDLMLYPQKAHHVAGSASQHMREAMIAFFEQTLK